MCFVLKSSKKSRRRTDIETTKKQFITTLQASSRGYLARENCTRLKQLQGKLPLYTRLTPTLSDTK